MPRSAPELVDTLLSLGAFRGPPPGPASESPRQLLEWCEAGLLEGGLAVALDVVPDELVGALREAVGGSARSLKVEDVVTRPRYALLVSVQARPLRWEVEDCRALASAFNEAFRADRQARAIATLGEWEDRLQLWCLDKRWLAPLLRTADFRPENRGELERQAR